MSSKFLYTAKVTWRQRLSESAGMGGYPIFKSWLDPIIPILNQRGRLGCIWNILKLGGKDSRGFSDKTQTGYRQSILKVKCVLSPTKDHDVICNQPVIKLEIWGTDVLRKLPCLFPKFLPLLLCNLWVFQGGSSWSILAMRPNTSRIFKNSI